ncbi:hypothetical protein ACJX0J_026257, partial [Zea mays]
PNKNKVKGYTCPYRHFRLVETKSGIRYQFHQSLLKSIYIGFYNSFGDVVTTRITSSHMSPHREAQDAP